jgi:D-alanyl-D-alanine carboxypeptidase (penicillin-binding protein 5/6)
MRVYPFGRAQGEQMRKAGRLAGAVAALVTIVFVAAPAAQAGAATKAVTTARPAAKAVAGPGNVKALSAELANAVTGKVLWTRAANARLQMGSITKVMTAYIVIKDGHLNRLITVPAGIISYDAGASTAGLVPGEKYTALQLLYALLVPSGCDAAFTLATAYGPGRATFIGEMNATARKLGLTRTHFADFSGLPVPSGTTLSTARDLIALGRDAMGLPLLRQIVATRTYHLAASPTHAAHTWVNYNTLLSTYPGAIGIKTGSTAAAGACVLFEARRGSKILIGVALHSASWTHLDVAFTDAAKMLNWGFTHYS